jgi:hypothetical protein
MLNNNTLYKHSMCVQLSCHSNPPLFRPTQGNLVSVTGADLSHLPSAKKNLGYPFFYIPSLNDFGWTSKEPDAAARVRCAVPVLLTLSHGKPQIDTTVPSTVYQQTPIGGSFRIRLLPSRHTVAKKLEQLRSRGMHNVKADLDFVIPFAIHENAA